MEENHILFKSATGQGSNNRAEPCVLWLLLKLAVDRAITCFQVLRQSKLVIDRVNGKNRLESLILQPFMNMVKEVRNLLPMVTSQHVYRAE